MSQDLARRRIVQEGTTVSPPQHLLILDADQFDNPAGRSWAVSESAPATTDPNDRRIIVRAFDDTRPDGVGFAYLFPEAPRGAMLELYARPATESQAYVEYDFDLYVRSLSRSLKHAKWLLCRAPEPLVIPPEKSSDFSFYGLGPFILPDDLGQHIQFEISRRPLNDERPTGDLLVSMFWITFDP